MQYLIKLSVSLSLVYLFYQLLLRRLTFYNYNRWYLLGYSLLCFAIPFINISSLVENKNLDGDNVIRYIPAIENYTIPAAAGSTLHADAAHALNYADIMMMVFLAGALIMTARLFMQYISLQKIKRKAVVISDTGTTIYHVDENIIPFSFGNAIYINKKQHSEKELEEIILHEYVHIKQKHTIDIVVAECLCIINWYNPFAWLTRHAIRQNLEFIADNDVLKKGLDKKSYQHHLLKVLGTTQYRIANSFNFSSLKKRIAMMNTFKSAKLQLFRFLFILPLMAVLLVAFRDKYKGIFKKDRVTVVINEVGIVVDINSKQPIAGVAVVDTVSGLAATSDRNGFYSLKIPVKADTGSIYLTFNKKGYQDSFRGSTFPVTLLQSHGQINVVGLVPPAGTSILMFGVPSFHSYPDDPTYNDALRELRSATQQQDDIQGIMKLKKDYPEVSMFYTSEYKLHQVVILQNGEIEKYGYPGGPSVDDMEKKYGKLPGLMTKNEDLPIAWAYLEKWAAISAKAEKEFHTSNPDVRSIVFPGDSRVIVVPKTGKPQFYDMDNAAPNERPAFEKLYGKLPGVVPIPANAETIKQDDKTVNTSTKLDTTPANIDASLNYMTSASVRDTTKDTSLWDLKMPPLYYIDGKEVTSAQARNLDTSGIESMNVMKDGAAISIFGERGRNGVILIKTKTITYNDGKKHDTTYRDEVSVQNGMMNWQINKDYPRNPLYLVDGKAVGRDRNMLNIKPAEIYIMELITKIGKGDLLNKYGDEAKDGVVNFVTKANKDNKAAYISPIRTTYDSTEMKAFMAEAAILNILYIGLQTPIKIAAEAIPAENLVVEMDDEYGGAITKRNGLYYASPRKPGNVEIKVFEKQKDGSLQLLNSRYFRVEYLPDPVTVVHFNGS